MPCGNCRSCREKRQQAVRMRDRGQNYQTIGKVFGVSARTARLWVERGRGEEISTAVAPQTRRE
jgi:transposase